MFNIKHRFEGVIGYGLEANKASAQVASQMASGEGRIQTGNIEDEWPWIHHMFDITLTDAALMYVPPDKIETVMDQIVDITRKGIVLVEWDSPFKLGVIRHYHWARDYKKLLEDRGLKVEVQKIPKGLWPTKSGSWENIGRIYIAQYPAR